MPEAPRVDQTNLYMLDALAAERLVWPFHSFLLEHDVHDVNIIAAYPPSSPFQSTHSLSLYLHTFLMQVGRPLTY